MEAAKTTEQSQMQEIDGEMRAVEKLKSQKQHLKTEVDKIEDEVSIWNIFDWVSHGRGSVISD